MKSLSRKVAVGLVIFSSALQIALIPNSTMQQYDIDEHDQANTGMDDAQGISFSDLGVKEAIQLHGPYQEVSIKFALPPDWLVEDDFVLMLDATSEFQALLEAFTSEDATDEINFKKGYLRAELNGISIGEVEIGGSENHTITFSAPGDLVNQDTKENELVISWDSTIACAHSNTSFIKISTGSELFFQHSVKTISLTLKDFPAPFLYDNSIIHYPVAFVIPDRSDEDNLTALMAVSSAFGKLGGEEFSYEIIGASELDQKRFEDHHIVIIGNLKQTDEMLVNGMGGDKLDAQDAVAGTESGFLTYRVSPWNKGRILLIVTGENGTALKKASSVISADSIIPFLNGNSAVIQEAKDATTANQFQIDRPLGDLVEEKSLQATSINETRVKIHFSIPGDLQISPESYLELYFRHSQLINYLRSNITIFINNNLVGTIRFSDHSAENGLARIILPPNVLRPFKNEMIISFTVIPHDICADERSRNYWVTIFGDSYLHIPPVLESTTESKPYTFFNLPSGLMRDSTFSNLVFLVGENEMQDWKYASRLAFTLGMYTDANIIQPAVRFFNSTDELENNKDYITISKMDTFPIYSEVNTYLPLPIKLDGEFLEESFAGIKFEIDSKQDIGLIESARIQDKQTTILGIFGNSSKGLSTAVGALIDQINSGDRVNANVQIIDGEGESHFYQFEPEKAVSEANGIGKEAWLDRLSNFTKQNSAFFLLIIFSIISISFSIWAFKKRSNHS